MEIKYLKSLESNPSINDSGFNKELQPISLQEIADLEKEYNNGQAFPTALKELLFLAGRYCYMLDYGFMNSQKELQDYVRRGLTKFGRNRVITNPFFVIDIYNAATQFLFVYLGEGEDPIVYEALLDEEDNEQWINVVTNTLSKFVYSGVNKVLNGYNPF